MYFLITGEGNSDVGYETASPGLLVCALEALAAEVSDETFSYDIISHSTLAGNARASTASKKMILTRGSKRREAGFAYVSRQAQAMAGKARETDNTGAVFFHDCDYTQSQAAKPDRYYRELVSAVELGFFLADKYRDGVAMIPKPRSESWLLAHYQSTPYQNSARFEDLPANDTAENSGKKKLAQFLGCNVNEIYSHIKAEDIQWQRIDAPSFVFFKNRFQHVVQRLTHQATTKTERDTLLTSYE